MSRHQMIRDIFDRIPHSRRGVNQTGEHVISLNHDLDTPHYATLERLSDAVLSRLSQHIRADEGSFA